MVRSLLETHKNIGSHSKTSLDSLKDQASIQSWAIIRPLEKRHLNGICRWADDAPLLVAFGSPLSPHQLNKLNKRLSDKTFWICACVLEVCTVYM